MFLQMSRHFSGRNTKQKLFRGEQLFNHLRIILRFLKSQGPAWSDTQLPFQPPPLSPHSCLLFIFPTHQDSCCLHFISHKSMHPCIHPFKHPPIQKILVEDHYSTYWITIVNKADSVLTLMELTF